MNYLGVPYRFTYQSESLNPNLKQIVVRVLFPNSISTIGNFALNAHPDPSLSGIYYFDFMTSADDAEGNYTFVVLSPEENIRIAKTESFYQRPLGEAMIVVDTLDLKLEDQFELSFISQDETLLKFEIEPNIELEFLMEEMEE